jgi:hypothetical protein
VAEPRRPRDHSGRPAQGRRQAEQAAPARGGRCPLLAALLREERHDRILRPPWRGASFATMARRSRNARAPWSASARSTWRPGASSASCRRSRTTRGCHSAPGLRRRPHPDRVDRRPSRTRTRDDWARSPRDGTDTRSSRVARRARQGPRRIRSGLRGTRRRGAGAHARASRRRSYPGLHGRDTRPGCRPWSRPGRRARCFPCACAGEFALAVRAQLRAGLRADDGGDRLRWAPSARPAVRQGFLRLSQPRHSDRGRRPRRGRAWRLPRRHRSLPPGHEPARAGRFFVPPPGSAAVPPGVGLGRRHTGDLSLAATGAGTPDDPRG